jgi:glycosyltransferase involved in cell wall biosynthesis
MAAYEIRHINTQVSRSLAEKGGQNQWRKSVAGMWQAARMVSAIATFRPQWVYLPLTNSPSFLGFLRDCLLLLPALLLRRRVGVRLHGGYYYYAHTRGLERWWVDIVLRRVSLAMVQGKRLLGCFDGLVPAERLAVVPNGLDDQPFAQARQRLARSPRPAGPKRVLFVGLLVKEKGVWDVIAAIPHVPGAHFVFAGEWPSPQDQQMAQKFLADHAITHRVTFAGVVTGPAKYDLFVSSDIFVFPSYFPYEGHAVSSVEALAAGLPIVCTDHGALNESVTDGWNGYFVPRSDPLAVADRLNRLLADDEQRQLMGTRSRQRYEECFTLAAFVGNWSQALSRSAHAR